MSHSFYHATSSANAFGGCADDYISIHEWFDRGRGGTNSLLHRALAHHTQGIADAVALFGSTITNSQGRRVPVSLIGEQHVREDLGMVPDLSTYIELMTVPRWCSRQAHLLHSRIHDVVDTSELETTNEEEEEVQQQQQG
jgi:hypothetical protein